MSRAARRGGWHSLVETANFGLGLREIQRGCPVPPTPSIEAVQVPLKYRTALIYVDESAVRQAQDASSSWAPSRHEGPVFS